MKRKGIAQETLQIQRQGHYLFDGATIDIAALQRRSVEGSRLITPEEDRAIMERVRPPAQGSPAPCRVCNQSTVEAILAACRSGRRAAALNFASAKNPGGGFLNGAMAQEEALAASSGLYTALLQHETYYKANRACGTMIYTDHAIYAPDVVFFRDGRFDLIKDPVTASVLTLPAVNMGQVLLKGEDADRARAAMKDRMRLCLAILADRGERYPVLGAYGCGVFRNDPNEVAAWWRQLLEEEGYGRLFDEIVFAVLDRSRDRKTVAAFERAFGGHAE